MRLALLACFGLALAPLACGGTVRQDEPGGSGSSGSGAAATSGSGGQGASGSGAGVTGSGGAPDCTDVGSNLPDACEAAALDAFVGTAKELSTSAAVAVADLTLGCRTLALDLGASMGDVTTSDPAMAAKAWCDVAAERVAAEVTSKGTLLASLQSPHCEVDASAQAACELACIGGKPECAAQLGDVKTRCPPGALATYCGGMCKATCDGSAEEGAACAGSCSGACTGSCEGVDMDEGACSGKCDGACAGSCAVSAPAATCPGACMGACDAAAGALACTEDLVPPSGSCTACADCTGACAAVGLVKTQCALPGVGLTASGGIAPEAVGSMRANLSVVFQAGARCERMVTALERLVGVVSSLQGELDAAPGAAGCLVDAADDLGAAAELVEACVEASVTLGSAAGG